MNAKEKLLNAFFELLSIKEFNAISVSELCVVAKVHRTTFYAYYDNTFELLLDAKDQALKDLDEEFKDIPHNDNFDYLSLDVVAKYINFVKKYPNLFKAYLKNTDILEGDISFNEILNKHFIPEAMKHGYHDEHKIILANIFFIRGVIGLVLYWLDNGCKESSETIASTIVGFGKKSVD